MSIKQRSVTDFFKEDKPVWATYDATRKLPSYVDGLKNSQRKLLWTGFSKAQKDFCKTETFANITALDTAYIHGAGSLCGVCDTLVQNFIGACNYPYFDGNDGGWGSRLIERSSAPRYTKLRLAEISKLLFKKVDNDLLDKQWFEGQYIEPKYLIPIFPTIFLNNSSGLTAGFSETVYSRNPADVIKYIKKKLNGVARPQIELAPWFKNFKGQIRYNADLNVYESVGLIVRNNLTSYTISELPLEVSYSKYIEILDKLEEDHMITGYEDKCNPRTNELLFEIKTTREFSKQYETIDDLNKVFKLVRSLPEQYNFIDENGKIIEFSNVKDVLDNYINLRFEFYTKRKAYLIDNVKHELVKLVSKFVFCKAIIDKTLVISNRKKVDIENDISKIDKIVKIDDSYDYLLRMPLYQITKEEVSRLKEQILSRKEELTKLKNTSEKDMWIEELTELEKALKA